MLRRPPERHRCLMTTAHERPRGMKVIHVWAFMRDAHNWTDRPMRAVIGRVKIKPDRADEALAMLAARGVALLQGMAGSAGGYWARSQEGDIIQHSFWLFDTEENARAAEATFSQLRDMPDAPATFISVDVCEIVGHSQDGRRNRTGCQAPASKHSASQLTTRDNGTNIVAVQGGSHGIL